MGINGMFMDKVLMLQVPETNEQMIEKEFRDLYLAQQLHSVICEKVDVNRDGTVSKQELQDAISDPELRAAFEVWDVPIYDSRIFFEALSIDCQEAVAVDL